MTVCYIILLVVCFWLRLQGVIFLKLWTCRSPVGFLECFRGFGFHGGIFRCHPGRHRVYMVWSSPASAHLRVRCHGNCINSWGCCLSRKREGRAFRWGRGCGVWGRNVRSLFCFQEVTLGRVGQWCINRRRPSPPVILIHLFFKAPNVKSQGQLAPAVYWSLRNMLWPLHGQLVWIHNGKSLHGYVSHALKHVSLSYCMYFDKLIWLEWAAITIV